MNRPIFLKGLLFTVYVALMVGAMLAEHSPAKGGILPKIVVLVLFAGNTAFSLCPWPGPELSKYRRMAIHMLLWFLAIFLHVALVIAFRIEPAPRDSSEKRPENSAR